MKLSKELSPLSQLSIIQLSIMQGEKSIIFPVVTCVRIRTFLKVRLFLSTALLAWIGLTLDLPRRIKSKTPGHMCFWEVSA